MSNLILTYKDKLNNEEIKSLQSLFYINLLIELKYTSQLDVSPASLTFIDDFKKILPTFSQFVDLLEQRKQYIDSIYVNNDDKNEINQEVFFFDYVIKIYYKDRIKEYELAHKDNKENILNEFNSNSLIKILSRLSERLVNKDWAKIKYTVKKIIKDNDFHQINYKATSDESFYETRIKQLSSMLTKIEDLSREYFFDNSFSIFSRWLTIVRDSINHYLVCKKSIEFNQSYIEWKIYNFEQEFIVNALKQYDDLIQKGIIQNHHIVYPNHIGYLQKNSGQLDDYQYFIKNEFNKIKNHFNAHDHEKVVMNDFYDNRMDINYLFDDMMSLYIYIIRNNYFLSNKEFYIHNTNTHEVFKELDDFKYKLFKLSAFNNMFDDEINICIDNRQYFLNSMVNEVLDLNIYEGKSLWNLILSNNNHNHIETIERAVHYLDNHVIAERFKSFKHMLQIVEGMTENYFFYCQQTQKIKNSLFNIVLKYYDNNFDTAFTNKTMFTLATRQIEINVLTELDKYINTHKDALIDIIGLGFWDQCSDVIHEKRVTFSSNPNQSSLIGKSYDRDIKTMNLVHLHNL